MAVLQALTVFLPTLLKCAVTVSPVSRALHSVFMVWRSGRVSSEWRDGIIISFYKGNGPKTTTRLSTDVLYHLLKVPDSLFLQPSE